MGSIEDVSFQHEIRFALVYASGWEGGGLGARTTSASPSRIARMVLTRFGGGSVVGVRILAIDGERVDYLIIPDRSEV